MNKKNISKAVVLVLTLMVLLCGCGQRVEDRERYASAKIAASTIKSFVETNDFDFGKVADWVYIEGGKNEKFHISFDAYYGTYRTKYYTLTSVIFVPTNVFQKETGISGISDEDMLIINLDLTIWLLGSTDWDSSRLKTAWDHYQCMLENDFINANELHLHFPTLPPVTEPVSNVSDPTTVASSESDLSIGETPVDVSSRAEDLSVGNQNPTAEMVLTTNGLYAFSLPVDVSGTNTLFSDERFDIVNLSQTGKKDMGFTYSVTYSGTLINKSSTDYQAVALSFAFMNSNKTIIPDDRAGFVTISNVKSGESSVFTVEILLDGNVAPGVLKNATDVILTGISTFGGY